MPKHITLTLIGRNGCHLCEIAQSDLARLIGEVNLRFPDLEYTVEDLDVDSSPELLARYSEEVPVLLLNQKQIAFFKIDVARALAAIEEQL